ncbi:hypothetical protein NBRC116594_12020 [Shimia sp. NS0008-38b]
MGSYSKHKMVAPDLSLRAEVKGTLRLLGPHFGGVEVGGANQNGNWWRLRP